MCIRDRVLTAGYYHYDLTTALDRAIPFLTISIIPYVLTYPYWYFGFLLAGTLENKHFFHIFVAIELLHVTTFFIFLFFPTTVVRPEVTADTLCGWLTTLIYTCLLYTSIHRRIETACLHPKSSSSFPLSFSYLFSFQRFYYSTLL